jgi:hypothetical protein
MVWTIDAGTVAAISATPAVLLNATRPLASARSRSTTAGAGAALVRSAGPEDDHLAVRVSSGAR